MSLLTEFYTLVRINIDKKIEDAMYSTGFDIHGVFLYVRRNVVEDTADRLLLKKMGNDFGIIKEPHREEYKSIEEVRLASTKIREENSRYKVKPITIKITTRNAFQNIIGIALYLVRLDTAATPTDLFYYFPETINLDCVENSFELLDTFSNLEV